MTIFRFLRETRAVAGIAGVLLTLMTLGGVALITDHLWLTHHRSLLKNAADAAVIATTIRYLELPDTMTDDEIKSHLQPLAERYVRSNLVGNVPQDALARLNETLTVDLELNRAMRTVAVSASAEMGGTLLAKQVLAYAGSDGITVRAGTESWAGTIELVLAIDVTASMDSTLGGDYVGHSDPTSRIRIVKEAARNLIEILFSHEKSKIAVGIVPWNYQVRLNQATRTRWEDPDNGWAVYPTKRTYPTQVPPTHDKYLSEEQDLPGRDRLPDACRAWAGCLDMRMVEREADSALRPSFSTVPPSEEPFLMGFFTDQTRYPDQQYVSYKCQAYTRSEASALGWEEPWCYDLDKASTGQECNSGPHPLRMAPQNNCGGPEIMPLTTDRAAAIDVVRGLRSFGATTYSSAGMAWAIRLLDSSWRDVWGHSEHPMDGNTDVKKIIVLLTDGEDNRFPDAHLDLKKGCTMAKDLGITIYTIAAMHPDHVRERRAEQLEDCSSKTDDPDGTYFFANNATPDALKQAFADIGKQLISIRRIY